MSSIISWVVINYVKLIISIIIIVVGVVIGNISSIIIRRRMHKDYSVQTAKLAGKAIYYLVSAIAIIVAIGNLGINLGSALVAGGFLGIVVGFAAQSSISNLIAGIFLIIDKPFKIGEFIAYQDMGVSIIDIGFFSTKAATWEGVQVRIPNNLLFNSNIINYTKSIARLVRAQFNLFYEEDINKVIPKIISEFEKKWFVFVEPIPQVFATTLSDKGITMEVRVWTAGTTWGYLNFSMIETIVNTLKSTNVKFAYPKLIITTGKAPLTQISK